MPYTIKNLIDIRTRGTPFDASLTFKVVKGGDLAVLKWYIINGGVWGKRNSLKPAVEQGRLDIIEFALENGCSYDSSIYKDGSKIAPIAARNGHIHILKYFEDHDYPLNYYYIMNGAAYGAHLDILLWLKDKGYNLHSGLYCIFADIERYDLFDWLKENGCNLDQNLIHRAMYWDPNIRLLKWFVENDCPVNKRNNNIFFNLLKNEEIKEYTHRQRLIDCSDVEGIERDCKYCIIELTEEVWKLWREEGYINWPPEEVIRDILLLL